MSEGDRPVWVKAGTYRAVMVDWKKGHPQFGRQVLLMRFALLRKETSMRLYFRPTTE